MNQTTDDRGPRLSRRGLGKVVAGAAAAAASVRVLAAEDVSPLLSVDPAPRFELSPYLYMQFMEPLGTTDSSVEASWDHLHDRWRPDLVEVTRELAPPMMRWGGIFCDFYRWREGVGPREERAPMLNLMWGGVESNQVGTAEFVDFCRQVGAEPLVCANFESDGRKQFMNAKGSVRTAGAREAAEWVAYCNDPDNAERRSHGFDRPLTVKHWQLGNETSFDRSGFDLETAAKKTVEFAMAMRKSDPSIKLIGWGDSGWASRMAEVAGEHLQYLAFHNLFNPDSKQPVLRGERYQRDPAATWEVLMKAWEINDAKIRQARQSLGSHQIPLALTECHFVVPGRDRCDVMSSWAVGAAYARLLNNHQRHGDVLKIVNVADFCGTRWQTNAIIIPVPGGRSYLMPVGRVMQLYRKHIGSHAVTVTRTPDGLDVVASRRGDVVYLHVVNTQRERAVKAKLAVLGQAITGGKVWQIVEDPVVQVSELNSGVVMKTVEKELPADRIWEFPAASVSAVEMAAV
ncbi:MAG: alpha-L-arabinofuranosidase [Tepidisphaeraceae bacterium]